MRLLTMRARRLLPILPAAILAAAISCAAGDDHAAAPTGTGAPAATAPTASIPATVLARGSDSGYGRERLEVIVRDEAAWKALWAKVHANVDPPPALPSVDFAKDTVIAVFLGERKSGGYAVEVASVERAGDGALVVVREKGPKPGAITAAMITSPYQIVSIPRVPGEIRFRRE